MTKACHSEEAAMINVFLMLFAYGIGLIPSAYIFSKLFKQVDIRDTGTGNVGSMNTIVNVGVLPGLLTLMSDAGKGMLVVALTMTHGTIDSLPILALFFLIFAHNYNPILNFKGGKGFGNLAGGLIMLSPLTIPAMIALTTVLLIVFKVPKVTAGFATLFFPAVFYSQTSDLTLLIGSFPITMAIFSKHIDNFKTYMHPQRIE